MAAEFVPLADFLRAPPSRGAEAGADSDSADADANALVTAEVVDVLHDGVRDVLREARLFRARLADAFDDAAARLLRELASDVLARELRLAPCDLASLVQRVAARAPVVRVRLAAGDVARAGAMLRSRGCDVTIAGDCALANGDAIVDVAGGAVDARLGVRLATVLEAFA